MGWITKYGTQWGSVPETFGRVFWVAPASPYTVEGRSYSSSDNNDGLSPERALATIQQAITNSTANAGDVIMLLPGSHTSASTVTLNVAGLTFVGCHPTTRISPDIRPFPAAYKVTWTSTFAGAGITNTAADTTFVGINFVPLTARSMMTCIATPRNVWIDCCLTLSAAASTSTKGFVFSGAAGANCAFVNCYFYNTIGIEGPALDLTAAVDFLVDKCFFTVTTGSWAVAVQLGAASTGTFRDCEFTCSGTAMTKGISGTGVAVAKSLFSCRNLAGVSPGTAVFTDMATTTYMELDLNYLGTVGGGTGATLLTTIS